MKHLINIAALTVCLFATTNLCAFDKVPLDLSIPEPRQIEVFNTADDLIVNNLQANNYSNGTIDLLVATGTFIGFAGGFLFSADIFFTFSECNEDSHAENEGDIACFRPTVLALIVGVATGITVGRGIYAYMNSNNNSKGLTVGYSY